jgi:RHS repeat-associated protein
MGDPQHRRPRTRGLVALIAIWLGVTTTVVVRSQDPDPPPTIHGSVVGDGSEPPVGRVLRNDGTGFAHHPTAYVVGPATIQYLLTLGNELLEIGPSDFTGTTGETQGPAKFTVTSVLPGELWFNFFLEGVGFTRVPVGVYITQPYFASDQMLSCQSPACSGRLDATLYSKWGTVKGNVKLDDGTKIPFGVQVRATPRFPPPQPPDERWRDYTTTTNMVDDPPERNVGDYQFKIGSIGPAPSDLCRSVGFPYECTSIPVPPDNKWGLPVLGDGGVEPESEGDKDFRSNTKGSFLWNIFIPGGPPNAPNYAGVDVQSNTASLQSFTIKLEDLFRALYYQAMNRPPADDSPEKDGRKPPVPCTKAPKPVSLITGNVFLDQLDVSLPGIRGSFDLVRSYNSVSERSSRFGYGWNDSFDKRVEKISGQILRLWMADGTTQYFTDPDEDGTFRPYHAVDGPSWFTTSAAGFLRTFRTGGYEQYDTNGRLLVRADRTGLATSYSYDSFGRLTSVTSPEGRRLRMEYLGGLVTRLLGPAGMIAEYSYQHVPFGDGLTTRPHLFHVRYADGTGYQLSYDGNHRLTKVTDRAGVVLHNHGYGPDGRATFSELSPGVERRTYVYESNRTLVTNVDGQVSTFEFETKPAGKLVSRVSGCDFCGASGGTETWEHDDQGRVTRYVNADNQATEYHWQGAFLTGSTNALGLETRYDDLDELGRPRAITFPGRGTAHVTYGVDGATSFTVPTGQVTTIGYENHQAKTFQIDGKLYTFQINGLGDVLGFSDPRGRVTSFTYDSMGRVTSTTTPDHQTTRIERGPGGRVTAVIRPDGLRVELGYDGSGNMISTKDAAGRQYSFTPDSLGRLAAMADPIGQTHFAYDPMSNLTSLVDALGHHIAFHYDEFGRLDSVVDPNAQSDRYQYYPSGLPRVHTDRNSTSRTFTYDGGGRLTSITYSDGTPALTLSYDDPARTATVSNGTDTVTRRFDATGRLISESSSLNETTVAYTYTNDHQRRTLALDGALIATYDYSEGILDRVRFDGGEMGFAYDVMNRRQTLSFPNGLTTSYERDPHMGWVTALRTRAGGSTALDISYGLDAVGDHLARTIDGLSETYEYDQGYRLVKASRAGLAPRQMSWSYDAVGNRTGQQVDGIPRSFVLDSRNRVLSSSGGGLVRVSGQTTEAASVLVDGQPARLLPGNVFEVDIAAPPGERTFVVEARDGSGNVRTKTYTVNVAPSGETYTYDANGNLTGRSSGTGSWTYEWNGRNELVSVSKDGGEVSRFSYDALGRRVRKVAGGVTYAYVYDGWDILRETRSDTGPVTYIHGPATDEPLVALPANGDRKYLHADALQSIVAVSDDAGNIVESRRYDAWGNLDSGPPPGLFGFTGREWDSATGLYFYRHRYYDPKDGRFISEDPIGLLGGINGYTYVSDNPTTLTDPFGLKAQIVRTGNHIDITYRVQFRYPKGVKPDPYFETFFQKSVSDTWTGKFGGFDVTTKVECGDDSTVDVESGKGRNPLGVHASGDTVVWAETPYNRTQVQAQDSGFDEAIEVLKSVMAHEAAHTWKVEDGYDPVTGVVLRNPYTGEDRTDIMAVILGKDRKVAPRELIDVLDLLGVDVIQKAKKK